MFSIQKNLNNEIIFNDKYIFLEFNFYNDLSLKNIKFLIKTFSLKFIIKVKHSFVMLIESCNLNKFLLSLDSPSGFIQKNLNKISNIDFYKPKIFIKNKNLEIKYYKDINIEKILKNCNINIFSVEENEIFGYLFINNITDDKIYNILLNCNFILSIVPSSNFILNQ